MRTVYPVVFLACAVMVMPVVCTAAEVSEEDVTPRTRKIYLDPETEKSFFEKGRIKNLVGVSVGYDDNTHLNSRRDGDAFTQTYFKTTFSAPVNTKVKGILSYDLMGLFYGGESSLNLVNNGFSAGIEDVINEQFTLTADYGFDWLEYLNSGSDDFLDNKLATRLKHKLPANFVHSLGHEFLWRAYGDRHTRTTATIYSDKKRSDIRNSVEYEIGKYFPKDLFKLGFEYYFNDSNEMYLNYYDYESYKAGASYTHLFNEKIFGYFSFSRQFRDFRSRTLSLDSNFKEWDRTYVAGSSLYYNINKSFTAGLSYMYRENGSNEPLENYSGSVISLSGFYKF